MSWLRNAHVPAVLLAEPIEAETPEGLVCVDLEIAEGQIRQVIPSRLSGSTARAAEVAPDSQHPHDQDLRRGIVLPCFVDMHTHLDKGHIWSRSPNLSGRFEEALEIVQRDREKNWSETDVYRRMEFALKCAYAHGTQAIRTHIDAFGEQAAISLRALRALQAEWRDRITLQAVSLVPIEYFQTPEGEKLADLMAETQNGVLGGLVLMTDSIDADLDRLFAMAAERSLSLDFHTDESGNPNDITLRHVAQAKLRRSFAGSVVCGHCCSLAVQPAAEVQKTLDLVKSAEVGIVSLPMCNLYLQDRNQHASQAFIQSQSQPPQPLALPDAPSHTPRWRGVTLIHELKQQGIPIAVASDNCRDPFFGFGDHDGLEVLTQAVRIAQLDAPYGDWCQLVNRTPAQLIGLPQLGQIAVGTSADLILFRARHFSELFARPQSDRQVLRQGQPIDTTPPDYAELDDLLSPA